MAPVDERNGTSRTAQEAIQLFSLKARAPAGDSSPARTIVKEHKVEHIIASSDQSHERTLIQEAVKELSKIKSKVGPPKSGGRVPYEEEAIAAALDRVLAKRDESISDIQRADLIIRLKQDLAGWGILQRLIDDPQITDIHCYDHKRIVVQKGKHSEETGLSWPSHEAYTSFIDRLLLGLDRSLSTQQHTIDASMANGVRICAIHESVCRAGGPYLSVRVPRVANADLNSIVSYQTAPTEIVKYLGALVKSGHATMIISGETGTGKTTLLRSLATQFGAHESIVAVEDTPEVNCNHRFFRCLVSRPSNTEGIGAVTLQEHIQSTLRMTPTRVILGEMRSPFAAEAFLESAQTGHVGMSTIHARNARETLVRLESLLGRAQKSVSLDIIRQQIALAVDVVVWLFREKGTGKPRIGEIIEVSHFIEGMIQVRPMFRIVERPGLNPIWKVESWSSKFDGLLAQHNVFLSEFPAEISLDDDRSMKSPTNTFKEAS